MAIIDKKNKDKLITLAEILKIAREKKQLLLREVASAINVDTAMISKFEKGERNPTREQIVKLAKSLDINETELLTQWLSEKIVYEVKDEEVALKAMQVAEKRIKYNVKNKK